MAQTLHRLSAKAVAAATKPGYLADGGNLLLQISPSGSKSWVFRYSYQKRARELGLGSAKDITLAMARTKASDYRVMLANRIDPITQIAQRKPVHQGKPFRVWTDEYIENNKAGWKNEKHAEQWANTLATYAYPFIGEKEPKDVTTPDMMAILTPIWSSKNETASRVRGRVEQVLAYARVSESRNDLNPAAWKGHLAQLLPRPSKVKKVKHFEALPFNELPGFFAKLRKERGIAAKALQFLILCASRTTEVTDAPRSELDLHRHRWTIPKERMKAGKEHRVPLTQDAMDVLKSVPPMAGTRIVFPSPRSGEPLSEGAMLQLLNRMGYGHLTVHGFRSTFTDWAAEIGNYPAELADMALAHTISDKVEKAYRRGDLYEKRVDMAKDWADFCLGRTKVKAQTPIAT